jgi:acyl carrier protein
MTATDSSIDSVIEEFLDLVRDETGLPVTAEQTELDLDQVPGWDSVYLLSLVVALERRTGRQLSMPDVLAATSLRDIYTLAVAP